MDAKDTFGEARLLIRGFPSYQLVKDATAELQEKYGTELDGVLMKARNLGDCISCKAFGDSLDLKTASMVALFSYEWLRIGAMDGEGANALARELMQIGKQYNVENRFKMGIWPVHTEHFLQGDNYRTHFLP